MGMVHAEITLKNVSDETKAELGLIKAEEIRTATVEALVDTGSMRVIITEELRQKLGLAVTGERKGRTANGQRVVGKITEAVEIQWKNRNIILPVVVLPGAKTILMGAMALEGMDLMVNPVTQELIGAHGDEEEFLCVGFQE